jgi:hypothetical protein
MPARSSVRLPFPTRAASTVVGQSVGVLSEAEKVAAIARVNDLERVLFGDEGGVERHTNSERADELLGAINELRCRLGWLCVDMARHQCWPAGVGPR